MDIPLRIMLVDDDPSIADILTPVLSDSGYEVVYAENGEHALELMPRAEPDLLLIDVMMPRMDGFELTQRLRGLNDFQHTPIVFLSALDSRSDIQKAYSLGVTVYLTKPVSVPRLLKNLKVFVENDKLTPRPKRQTMRDLKKPATAPQPRLAPKPAVPAPPPAPEVRPAPPRPAAASLPEPSSLRPAAPAPRPPRSSGDKPIGASEHIDAPTPRPAPQPPASPAPPQPPAPVSSAPTPTPIPHQTPRVMIVEDDPDILDVMTATLDQQFEVITAGDGLDAVKKIETLEPDMFVIDLMMPRLNGYQLIHTLRATPATAGRPVLVVSAKSSRADQKHALAMGGNDFLAKPFQPGDLLDRLTRLTQQPGFRVISPKQMSMREIISDDMRRRLQEEEKKALEELQRKSEEERKSDPFSEEEHVRGGRGLKADFADMKGLFKKGGKEK